MNLVFNTYITDEPLNAIHGEGSLWQGIREADTTFRKRSKVDIFKYTLDSYKYLPFNKTYFWVQCENESRHKEINDYILNIWPDAYINNKRCLTFPEYKEMLDIVPDDDWVFFSPNNDQVFWASERIDKDLNELLRKFWDVADGMVSIFYSHLEEFRNLPFNNTWFGQKWNTGHQPRFLLDQTEKYVCFSSMWGDNTSVQILHPKLLKALFGSCNFGNKEIRRQEDLFPHFQIFNQVSVVPRFDFCVHFDGQPSLDPFVLPPLFIPDGYFENDIKIVKNEPIYQVGKLNISTKYRLPPYLDPYLGADFIGSYYDLPIFLKDKIFYD